MVPRKKWRAIPRKARNTKRPTGSKSGHGYPAMILGDGDVADRVYLSFFRLATPSFTLPKCKTFALFLFTFDYPRVNVVSPTNNAVRPSEVVIESLAGRERSRRDRERRSYTMQSARTTARCSATDIGRRARRGGAPIVSRDLMP